MPEISSEPFRGISCHVPQQGIVRWEMLVYVILVSSSRFVCIFRPGIQLLEHNTFICHLLHVSAIFDHRQVFFTTTYVEKHAEVEALPSQLIHPNTQVRPYYFL